MAQYVYLDSVTSNIESTYLTDYSLGSTVLLPEYFGSVATVNIFLGENNSGKSRFMRELMKFRYVGVYDINFSQEELISVIDNLLDLIELAPKNMPGKIHFHMSDDASDLKYILELLRHKSDDIHMSYTLNLTPNEYLSTIKTFVNEIKASTIDLKSLLNMLNGKRSSSIGNLSKVYNDFNKSLSILFSLEDPVWGAYRESTTSSIQYSKYSVDLELYGFQSLEPFKSPEELDSYVKLLRKCLVPISSATFKILSMLYPQRVFDSSVKPRTYIPVLRTGRKLVNSEGYKANKEYNLLEHTTRLEYDLSSLGLDIKTGFNLYEDINSMYKARIETRERLHQFESFLSKSFFGGKTVTIVPEQEDGKNGGNILITLDNEERDIQHLGDGIQAVILLLFPLFMSKGDEWFFIEEPETHLHPGFQRLFIKTITTNNVLIEKNLKIFLTTHSNHILDFAIDEAKNINIFTFRKILNDAKNKYQIQLSQPRDLSNLTELGVQNSSVFLSNCTIWIEGITDRIYLSAYLKCFLSNQNSSLSLIEGLHYSFLEYAGANVAHYTFNDQSFDDTITPEALQKIKALSISNRIMLIADQDGGAKTKRDEQLSNEQHNGFEYRVLGVREIENLLSPEIIVKALKELYPKEESTFDASLLNLEDYKQEYLGSYLRNKFSALPENFAPSDGSGTIGSAKKRRFAEKAAESLISWEMLTPEAQKLTREIFNFIIGHNPRLGSN